MQYPVCEVLVKLRAEDVKLLPISRVVHLLDKFDRADDDERRTKEDKQQQPTQPQRCLMDEDNDKYSKKLRALLSSSSRGIQCDVMCVERETVVVECEECKEFLCEFHHEAYLRTKATMTHVLVLIRPQPQQPQPKQQQQQAQAQAAVKLSHVHTQRMKVFCKTCDKPIFQEDCAVFDHCHQDLMRVVD